MLRAPWVCIAAALSSGAAPQTSALRSPASPGEEAAATAWVKTILRADGGYETTVSGAGRAGAPMTRTLRAASISPLA